MSQRPGGAAAKPFGGWLRRSRQRTAAPAQPTGPAPQPAEVAAVFPWRAAGEAGRAVAGVLESLGVDYWGVHPLHTPTAIWACHEQHWPKVLGRLQDALASQGYALELGKSTLPLEPGRDWGDRPVPASVRLVRPVRDADTGRASTDQSCELQLWRPTAKGTLEGQARTGVVQELPARPRVETTPLTQWDGYRYPRPAVLARPDQSEIDFPVDAVYLWVDGSDPAWLTRRESVRARLGLSADDRALAAHRFRDRGELRASLRSLEMYAPWLRRIFLVTDQQRPSWLDPGSPRITLIDHRDIFADPEALPTYNSHAIGSQVHRIDGLADRYLIINDDVLFNKTTTPYDFFTPEGLLKVTFSRSRRPLLPLDELNDLMRARANSAALIEDRHNRPVTRLFAHVPVPQSLEVAREIAAIYVEEIDATMRHPFRTGTDVEPNSWLHLYHALFTGRAVEDPVRFGYLNLTSDVHRSMMETTGGPERALVMCVNDVAPGPDDEATSAWFTSWLQRRFPVPVGFELLAAGNSGGGGS